jgi:chromatin assembly factor 1 subunit A
VQARVSAGSNGFSTIEYVELRTVRLRNKMKYLHFAEDYRPPYFGTFSKRSTALNGRRPDKKDEELFNYDYDSEAEWEEEEEGEDLGESEDGDEEPADDLVYDDFFCKDDDLGSDAVRQTLYSAGMLSCFVF